MNASRTWLIGLFRAYEMRKAMAKTEYRAADSTKSVMSER